MTDVLIPEPSRKAVTSPLSLTGTLLTGQTLEGDSWVDNPLGLDGGAGTVLVGTRLIATTGDLALVAGTAESITTSDQLIQVGIVGYLDLLGDAANLFNQRNLTIAVVDTGALALDAAPADLFWQRQQFLVGTTATLDLDGGPVRLIIWLIFRIKSEDTLPLALDGGEGIVNPFLIPEVCDDLDLIGITCTDLDLATVASAEITLTAPPALTLDLAPVVPIEHDLDVLVCEEA